MSGRHPADVIDPASGKVRVLSGRCSTCLFRRDTPVTPERIEQVVSRNLAVGALLTCHSTLPYGPYPDFGPAVCAGFWARHGLSTAAGFDPGLLASATWEEMDAFADQERVRCLEFAAAWREHGTPFSIEAAECNEARAARLAEIVDRHRRERKQASGQTGQNGVTLEPSTTGQE